MSHKVLVTGGAGYIGSHAVIELYNKGYIPIIIDNLSNTDGGSISNINKLIGNNFIFYEADIGNENKIKNILKDHQNIFSVIHFAGSKSVEESVINPDIYYQNNVSNTISFLKSLSETNIKNFIFSSSASVYSEEIKPPYSEISKVAYKSPYAHTKLLIENILESYSQLKSWNISVLRYFNPAGCHESCLLGEKLDTSKNLFPSIAKSILNSDIGIKVYGHDFETKDGTGVRDFIHVEDLVKAHIKTMEISFKNKYEILNLGSGNGYSVLEVLQAFEDVIGKKIKFEKVEKRKGDVAMSVADTTKSRELLNFIPSKNLYEMCKDTLNWAKKCSS